MNSKLNIIKDINQLILEDFSFQSRGIKSREEEKRKREEEKQKAINEIIKKYSNNIFESTKDANNKLTSIVKDFDNNIEIFIDSADNYIDDFDTLFLEFVFYSHNHLISINFYYIPKEKTTYIDINKGSGYMKSMKVQSLEQVKSYIIKELKEYYVKNNFLKEDFNFQSRNIKGRVNYKKEIENQKIQHLLSKKSLNEDESNFINEMLYTSKINTLGNIEDFLWNLNLDYRKEGNLIDLSNLKFIDGDLDLQFSDYNSSSIPENLVITNKLYLYKSNVYHIPESCLVARGIIGSHVYHGVFNSAKEYNNFCISKGLYAPKENIKESEGFKFQSRNIKGRQEEKRKEEETKETILNKYTLREIKDIIEHLIYLDSKAQSYPSLRGLSVKEKQDMKEMEEVLEKLNILDKNGNSNYQFINVNDITIKKAIIFLGNEIG